MFAYAQTLPWLLKSPKKNQKKRHVTQCPNVHQCYKWGARWRVWATKLEASGALDQCKIINAFEEILSQQKTLTEEEEEEKEEEDPNIDMCIVNAKTSMCR